MTTTLLSVLLGGGGLLTALYALVTNVRDRKRNVSKQESDLALSKGTYQQIAADAARINSDERIATERWWKEQFDAVKDELSGEQRWRRRVTKWAKSHEKWDELAWHLAVKTDPNYPAPPRLEDQDDDDL